MSCEPGTTRESRDDSHFSRRNQKTCISYTLFTLFTKKNKKNEIPNTLSVGAYVGLSLVFSLSGLTPLFSWRRLSCSSVNGAMVDRRTPPSERVSPGTWLISLGFSERGWPDNFVGCVILRNCPRSLYTSTEKLTLRASSRLDHIYQCRVCKSYCLCRNHNSDPKSVKKVPNVFQNI